jgi:hypothetical protein
MPIAPIEIPDATTQPAEYKQALLDLIGDRKSAAVIAQTTVTIEHLVEAASDSALQASPGPGEWSAADVIGHLFDVDIVYGFRWRLVLTEDGPTYPGYDEKKWTPLPRLPFWPQFRAWQGLRAANIQLLRMTPMAAWNREGFHGEQGGETFDEMVRKLAAHDLAHINQIERALESAGELVSGAAR